MSLGSRFQVCFKTVAKRLPAFQPLSRCMDIGDKGKAEENAYFRKEQARLLEKLKKFMGMENDVETKDKADKHSEHSKENSEQKDAK